MIRYRLPLSRLFPSHHIRKGEPTNFEEFKRTGKKKTTIRANYEYWSKRIDRINKGEACLEIYEWTGKPYCSKAKTLFTITEELSYQAIEIKMAKSSLTGKKLLFFKIDGQFPLSCLDTDIYENDGLSETDFKSWFQKDLINGIIIHFTNLKY